MSQAKSKTEARDDKMDRVKKNEPRKQKIEAAGK